jgi:hypothetical protein
MIRLFCFTAQPATCATLGVGHRVSNMLEWECMRKVKIVSGEYYHVYNRGNNKQSIFRDEKD